MSYEIRPCAICNRPAIKTEFGFSCFHGGHNVLITGEVVKDYAGKTRIWSAHQQGLERLRDLFPEMVSGRLEELEDQLRQEKMSNATNEALRKRGAWTTRRVEQLDELRKILGDCSDLNRATHIIERLCRISTGAEALTKADLGSLEPSFLEFITQLCRDDRRNQNQENRT